MLDANSEILTVFAQQSPSIPFFVLNETLSSGAMIKFLKFTEKENSARHLYLYESVKN